ncbi:MAG: ABC transporter permease, partial [Actinomycetota bacterium]
VYLIGRALAQLVAVAIVSAVVTLIIGRYGLHVQLTLSPLSVSYTFAAMILGGVAVTALGLVSCAGVLHASHESWSLPDGVAAGLYLLSGAIYPITILPAGLEWVARALPLSWWLEATRRGLTPYAPRQFPATSDAGVLGTLAALTAILCGLSWMLYAASERRARRVGGYDERTGY